MLLTKCEPADIVSASAARRLDHMIRRHAYEAGSQILHELRQVQHRKCCGRCAPESSYTDGKPATPVWEPQCKSAKKGGPGGTTSGFEIRCAVRHRFVRTPFWKRSYGTIARMKAPGLIVQATKLQERAREPIDYSIPAVHGACRWRSPRAFVAAASRVIRVRGSSRARSPFRSHSNV